MGNRHLKIDTTDIFLEDGPRTGQGKITVSDGYKGAYTTSWGAMGGSLSSFLCSINESYFTDCMLDAMGKYVFDGKGSVRNIRKFIREELDYELPWYKFMSAQKEMRENLKELESCGSEESFVYACNHFVDGLICYDMSYNEEIEFKDIIRNMFECEPWGFIDRKPSKNYLWLCDLHKKIKKRLS